MAIGIAYHYRTINSLERSIAIQSLDLATYSQQVTTMEQAANLNLETINSLNKNISEQAERISSLGQVNTNIERERDDYLSIFKRHNLSELARRKPGLIERSINRGTAEVFQDLINITTGVEVDFNSQN